MTQLIYCRKDFGMSELSSGNAMQCLSHLIDQIDKMSRGMRKPVSGVSDKVPHKPACTATEDGQKLEISDLGRRGIVLSN